MICSVSEIELLKPFFSNLLHHHIDSVTESLQYNLELSLKKYNKTIEIQEGFLKDLIEILILNVLNEEEPEVIFQKAESDLRKFLLNTEFIGIEGFIHLLKALQKSFSEYLNLFDNSKELPDALNSLFLFFNAFEIFLLESNESSFSSSRRKSLANNIIHNSIDGIIAFDNTLRITEFNASIEKVYGRNRTDVLGKKINEVLPNLVKSGEMLFYERVLKGICMMVPEVTYVKDDNEEIIYNTIYTPILSDSGAVVGGIAVIHDITKRKKAEEKLKEEKKFSESLINNSIDGIMAFNNSYICTAWNPQMEYNTGVSKENAIGKPVFDIFSENCPFDQTTLEKAVEGEIIFFQNENLKCSPEKFDIYVIPVYDNHKRITGGLVIAHNVTERLKNEETFRELSESLKHTVEGIALIDEDGNFLSVNKATEKILGKDVTGLIGKKWLELIDPEDIEMGQKAFERAAAEGSANFEAKIKSKQNTYTEITIVPYLSEHAGMKGFHLFFKDISERKTVEYRLKKSEALLIESQELAKLGSWEYEPSTGRMSWSDEMFRIFGLKPKEIQPDLKTLYSLLPEFSKSIVSDTWKKIFKTFKPSNLEFSIRMPDGKTRVVYGQAKPVLNTFGEIIKISGYIQDITERKEAEKILKEAYQELKLAEEKLLKVNIKLENRVKERTEELSRKNEELKLKNNELLKINSDLDNFIYTASHDLKSPISNIEGLINTLSDELLSQQNTEYDTLIQLINTCINKFKNTITDLTEITKIQKNIDEEISMLNITDLIEEVKYDIKELFVKSQTELVLDIQENKIQFSRKNLRSILYNLISNAIKYRSPERKPWVKVTVSRSEENYLLIKVQDNGLGLDLNQKDKIFRMFKRMHTHVEGTGIGLYIVKRIIENSGGRIEVESILRQGTEFRVFLKT